MNIALLLPDGVGIRNFVHGPFLHAASRDGSVHALHTIPEQVFGTFTAAWNGSVRWHPLLQHHDRPLCFLLRNCLTYSQGYWINSHPMQIRWKAPTRGSWRTRTAVSVAKMIGRSAASPRGIQMLDRLHTMAAGRLPEVGKYRELFRQIKPDVLFCSHQRPPQILAPVLAARSLGTPTATFIFSWDNLSSKGRIAAPFDHYLVWSSHMRDELLRYYPDVAPHRVHIVGTPQFDPYGDPSILLTREEFFGRIGADPGRPLICFSGGDASNAVEDPQHVRVLLESIRSGRIKQNPQVLLRPCPVDNFERFDSVRRDFPELIYSQPEWLNTCGISRWSVAVPSANDIQMLANLTYHCDLNVNFASTMTLDFAIRDKPVVNVAFDVSQPPCFGMPMFDYLELFEHYRPVNEFRAARCARSADDLANHINAYLEDPSLDREGRKRFVEFEIGVPIGQSSQAVLEVLQKIRR